ncbi:MAG TPA: hypothetical protein VFV37_02655 [Luteibaculaceae bacterium]|nr:hypothetical protein [Luteibaculaceae bacterium]
MALRTLTLFLLFVLLLDPVFKRDVTDIEKPKLVLVVDQSASMLAVGDSVKTMARLKSDITTLQESLRDNYDVRVLGADEHLRAEFDGSFKGTVTDYGNWQRELIEQFNGQLLGGVVWMTDGIQNQGESPLNQLANLKAKLFPIAYGDTTVTVDAAINEVTANKTVVKGNAFPVVVNISAAKLAGQTTVLEITDGEELLASQTIAYNSQRFSKDFSFIITANKLGYRRLTIRLKTATGEITSVNNLTSLFIEVKEEKQRVVLVYNQPHPDLGAIYKAVGGLENFSCQMLQLSEDVIDLKPNDLVVLQVNGAVSAGSREKVKKIAAGSQPVLVMLGPNTDWNLVNSLGLGVKMSGPAGQNAVQARLNEAFQGFSTQDIGVTGFQNLPPLVTPFGEVEATSGYTPVLYQQLGRLNTDLPLWAVNSAVSPRRAAIFGEGIWRWRMADFQENQSHNRFDALIDRLLLFLAVTEDQNRLQVAALRRYREGAFITLGAELRDEANQSVEGKEIKMRLRYNDSLNFDYSFSPSGGGYSLELGQLPAGLYNYTATTELNGKNLATRGVFVVEDVDLELANTSADHNVLAQLASLSGGAMARAGEANTLVDRFQGKNQVAPVLYTTTKIVDAMNWKWIFALIIASLGVEWYFRKRNGLQ